MHSTHARVPSLSAPEPFEDRPLRGTRDAEDVVKDPGKLSILVVDDEPTIRGVIGQVLRMDGHDPTEVASAEEALEAFRTHPFPLVITDIIMGGMSGLELLGEIKRIAPETLVVIMTSQASLEAATTALRGGAYDFLVKPFDDLILISALVERVAQRLILQNRNLLLQNQLEMYTSELERLNRHLKESADRDWLTGLHNRRYLRAALDSGIARSTRQQQALSLILLDVDNFKIYNDTRGHLAGDEVLRGVALILQSISDAEQVCARYGGEEFVVMIPGADRERALRVAERIRCSIEAHSFDGGETQPQGTITVSLGVATFPEAGPDGTALIREADAALYRAKELGRNRVET